MSQRAFQENPLPFTLTKESETLDLVNVPGKKGEKFVGGRPLEGVLPLPQILYNYAVVFQTADGQLFHMDNSGVIRTRKDGQERYVGMIDTNDPLLDQHFSLSISHSVRFPLFDLEQGKEIAFPTTSPVTEIVVYDRRQQQTHLEMPNLSSPLLMHYLRR